MSNFESIIEINVNKQIDKMFGDKDSKLKIISKLDIMNDDTEESKLEIENMIKILKKNNEIEAYYINKESYLTYDKDGNLVEITN
jgi:hypothetical protein